ncbi:MAG TPA: hypothetical protein VHF89_19280, partial [Solirubrobacteraceae bacterium]|nr:hypothetical protein [Solirubrobacteraceae bacterium]
EDYEAWWHERRRSAAADRRPHRWVALMLEADGYIEMNWEVASRLGIRRVFPFATRAVLEQAFRWHPAELIRGGPPPQTKKMLRAALRDDVPAENLMRTDRGWYPLPGRDDPLPLGDELPPALTGIVRDDWLAAPPRALPWRDAQWVAALAHIGRHLAELRPRSRGRAVAADLIRP